MCVTRSKIKQNIRVRELSYMVFQGRRIKIKNLIYVDDKSDFFLLPNLNFTRPNSTKAVQN